MSETCEWHNTISKDGVKAIVKEIIKLKKIVIMMIKWH